MECGIESDPDMLKMGVVNLDNFIWFRDHFDIAGDPQPNGHLCEGNDQNQHRISSYVPLTTINRAAISFRSFNKLTGHIG